jgi:arsenate reductase
MKILFICSGNVGRSQMAEATFNKLTGYKYDVSSAGTEVGVFEGQALKDLESSINVLKVLNEINLDIKYKMRINVSVELIESSDIVVSMVKKEKFPDLLSNKKIIYWEVEDPFNKSIVFTRDTRNKIELLVKDLIRNNNL